MKKILVVGATYSNNFGDMLFAKMIADALDGKAEFRYYLLSDYAKNFVGESKIGDFPVSKADALVYMPGGFFGDRHDTSLVTTLYWFRRYFPIGLRYAFSRKPLLVLGVGAGPCKYTVMRWIIKYICKRATKIIVRETDSEAFLNGIGVKCQVASDWAQRIVAYPLPDIPLLRENGGRKRLLIHVNQNQGVAAKVLPAVQEFYEKHKNEYSLVVASDQVCREDEAVFERVRAFAGDDVVFYKYGDPMELCSLISRCDTAITYKLHMGIVACAYGKSVIAIPEHYKKVERYYKHIGYPERVLPLYQAETPAIYDMLEAYADKPITVPQQVMDAAQSLYGELDGFVRELDK